MKFSDFNIPTRNIININDTDIERNQVIIERNKSLDEIRKMGKTNKDDIDPYNTYRYFNNMNDNERLRVTKKTILIVNSNTRINENSFITDNNVVLHNALKLNVNSSYLIIKGTNDTKYEKNDYITLSCNGHFVKKIIVTDENFIFTNGSSLLNIIVDPEIGSNEPGTKLLININGFQGDSPGFFGNIQLNLINSVHEIIYNVNNINQFSIDMGIKYNDTGTLTTGYPVEITFYYIAGISEGLILAGQDEYKYYHQIKEIEHIDNIPYYKVDLLVKATKDSEYFGGSNISIGKIIEKNYGSVSSSDYYVKLQQPLPNVLSLNVAGVVFPDPRLNVYNGANKLYWKNLNDGDHIYSVTFPDGLYNASSLAKIIEDTIYNVKRINYTSESTYTNHNIIKVNINEQTSVVNFNSYEEHNLIGPLIGTEPSIETQTAKIGENKYKLLISFEDHGLNVGDKITITGSISYRKIPADIINGEHEVYEIFSSKQFAILLQYFNPEDEYVDSGGGNTFKILKPTLFTLNFTFNDTIGELLGFRNVGSVDAVTNYLHKISNTDPYFIESFTKNNIPGRIEYNITNNKLKLSGYPDAVLINIDYGKGYKTFACIYFLVNGISTDSYITRIDPSPYFDDNVDKFTISDIKIKITDLKGNIVDLKSVDHLIAFEVISTGDVPPRTVLNTSDTRYCISTNTISTNTISTNTNSTTGGQIK